MKLLCESCERLAAPGSWSVEGGTLRLACAGCGHVHEVPGSPPTPAVRVPPPPEAAAGWLAGGWAELRERWAEAAAHERLIAEAAARSALADLGRLYRDAVEADPSDEHARTGREALIRRASAQLVTGLPSQESGLDPAAARRTRSLLFAAMALALLAFVAWAFVRSNILPVPP